MASDTKKSVSEATLRWVERMEFDAKDDSFRIESASDLFKEAEDEPEWYQKSLDDAYRDGVEDGFDYCVEQVQDMYRRKGFSRVSEIVNILWHWSEHVLKPWKFDGEGKFSDKYQPHPKSIQEESWGEIRERVIRRDGKCVRCSDVLKLEVDHIQDVQYGGRPIDSNLRTLCSVCHKGKSLWDSGAAIMPVREVAAIVGQPTRRLVPAGEYTLEVTASDIQKNGCWVMSLVVSQGPFAGSVVVLEEDKTHKGWPTIHRLELGHRLADSKQLVGLVVVAKVAHKVVNGEKLNYVRKIVRKVRFNNLSGEMEPYKK